MIEIREISHGSEEYERMLDLRRRILRWPLGLDFSRQQIEEEAGDLFLGAFTVDGGQLVGCLVLTPLANGEIKMRQVAVQEVLRGAGVGRRLVEESERAAFSRGFERMVLNARDTAVPFYKKLGYSMVGDPFEEVTIPHRKMLKDLAG